MSSKLKATETSLVKFYPSLFANASPQVSLSHNATATSSLTKLSAMLSPDLSYRASVMVDIEPSVMVDIDMEPLPYEEN